ncbi:hypothetical protein SAMN05421833_14122 [Microbispora rosea]|uniref:Uncharacterized protein n=1 Tax=Microbispora rosea TaxID=58117 RepID=A0A1N7HAR5_9ACTN|nr:hypothetical protein SAMN05421833_14122 [Microbispora rosea]
MAGDERTRQMIVPSSGRQPTTSVRPSNVGACARRDPYLRLLEAAIATFHQR